MVFVCVVSVRIGGRRGEEEAGMVGLGESGEGKEIKWSGEMN